MNEVASDQDRYHSEDTLVPELVPTEFSNGRTVMRPRLDPEQYRAVCRIGKGNFEAGLGYLVQAHGGRAALVAEAMNFLNAVRRLDAQAANALDSLPALLRVVADESLAPEKVSNAFVALIRFAQASRGKNP